MLSASPKELTENSRPTQRVLLVFIYYGWSQLVTCFDLSCGHHQTISFTRNMQMLYKCTYMERIDISVCYISVFCVFLLPKSVTVLWELQEHNRKEFLSVVRNDCMGCGNIPRTYYPRACST